MPRALRHFLSGHVWHITHRNEEVLTRQYERWVMEALQEGNLTREDVWSSNIAAGSKEFIEMIKRRLHKIKTQGPRLVSGREQAVWEEAAEYGQSLESNMLEWEIESEKSNNIRS